MVNDILTSNNCSQVDCLAKIEFYHENYYNQNCRIPFYSYPDNGEWVLDRFILENLNLSDFVNLTNVDQSHDFIVEINDFAEKKYATEDPFMVYIYNPNEILDSKSGMEFVEVQLPVYSKKDCELHYFTGTSSSFACGYPEDYLMKVVNIKLEAKSPEAYRFLSRFEISKDEMQDLQYRGAHARENDVACDFAKDYIDVWASFVPARDVKIEQKIGQGITIFVTVLAGALTILAIINAVLVIVYRKNQNIKSGSSLFLFFISCGCALNFLYVLLGILTPSKSTCMIIISLEIFSFFAILAALIFKVTRVAILFELARPSKRQRTVVKRLSDAHMLIYYAVIMTMVFLYITIFLVVAPPKPTSDVISSENLVNDDGLVYVVTVYENHCASDSAIFRIIFMAFQIGLSLLGCYLAFTVRNTPSAFSAAKLIGISMYNLFMCTIVSNILRYLSDVNSTTIYVTVSIFTIFPTAVILFFVVSSRIYCIFRGWIPDFSKIYRTSSKDSSKNKTKMYSRSGSKLNDRTHGTSRRGSQNGEKMNSIVLDIVREDGTKGSIMVIQESEDGKQNKSSDGFTDHIYDGA
eukprot:Awhi_evm2s6241